MKIFKVEKELSWSYLYDKVADRSLSTGIIPDQRVIEIYLGEGEYGSEDNPYFQTYKVQLSFDELETLLERSKDYINIDNIIK